MAEPAQVVPLDPAADPTAADALFQVLASELERARAVGLSIEGAICALAVRSASSSDSVLNELQQLDAVLQHLGALRDFVAELARGGANGAQLEIAQALERVNLGEVRARLAGRTPEERDADDGCELF